MPSFQRCEDYAEHGDQDLQFEQGWDCFEDCSLSQWESLSHSNYENPFQDAETILKMFCEDDKKRKVMQSRIVTLIFRHLSCNLNLTKNQNNQLVEF